MRVHWKSCLTSWPSQASLLIMLTSDIRSIVVIPSDGLIDNEHHWFFACACKPWIKSDQSLALSTDGGRPRPRQNPAISAFFWWIWRWCRRANVCLHFSHRKGLMCWWTFKMCLLRSCRRPSVFSQYGHFPDDPVRFFPENQSKIYIHIYNSSHWRSNFTHPT